jgi:tetratricopeptide (TPR) repeat protein
VIPFLFALAAAAAPQPAGPSDTPDNRYRACVSLARSAPDQAVRQAEAWLRAGGGIRAGQCLGLAQSRRERWAEAAIAFEAAAREAEAKQDRRRADLWVQAGNAHLAASDAARARKALDSALAANLLPPELRGEAHADRARAAVALGDRAAARADLEKALQLAPADPFVWYLSAALARQEKDLARAQAQIARAVSLAPDSPDILLEAANIAAASGEGEAAEALFARTARMAPNSEAGRSARAALGQPPQPK